jgi:hypothetical protein
MCSPAAYMGDRPTAALRRWTASTLHWDLLINPHPIAAMRWMHSPY